MFETLKNALKVKEIRIKILFTLLLLLVYRVGCYIPIPGINADTLERIFDTAGAGADFLGLLSTLTGGAMQNGTLFALGILPFINASIIMNLLTLAIPRLEKLSKEGEEGRRKMTQITRIMSLVLALVQAIGIVASWNNNATAGSAITSLFGFEEVGKAYLSMSLIVVILVGGSTMVMWLGERITEYGVGNGTSLIIFIGILSSFGTALAQAFNMLGNNWVYVWNIIGFLLVVGAIFVFIVFMDLSERKVPVQYSKQIKGNKMYGGQTTHIPIRINAGGVMPIIFASSFLMFPQMIMQLFWSDSEAYRWYATNMGSGTWVYYVFLAVLILFFSYFYAMIQFNPDDVSRNIQQYGGFIPGIRAGKPTSDYLRKINNRITLFGALFLAVLALLPTFVFNALSANGALGFGGAFSATGLLIVVSVALEFDKQLESQIMMRHYKGFLK
jgi:preprotein translocase subunit SecY